MPVLKRVITIMLKFRAHLNTICKRVCVTMLSLVMSPFSHDLITVQVD